MGAQGVTFAGGWVGRNALRALGLALSGCGPVLLARLPPLEPAEALVVLGNRPPVDERGEVAPETERRVRRGVELFLRGWAPRLVMTGGPAPSGDVEALVMRRYALELGVPPAAVLAEPTARSTIENARNTVSLLCQGRVPCRPRVIVVSSPFHLRRARELFRCAGAEVQVAPTESPDDRAWRVGSALWERLAQLSYLGRDACAEAAGRR